MAGHYTDERIENWVGDFCGGDGVRGFSAGVREVAGEVLGVFLKGACAVRGVEPEELEEGDVRAALLGPVAKLGVSEEVRKEVPGLCGALLVYLEEEGRVGGGRGMGAFVRALGEAYGEAASGKVRPIVRAGSRVGRNDPCPCGSGKKYKKCCMKEE